MSQSKQFSVSQQAVIRNDRGEVLILLRPTQDFWLLPGGRVEDKETLSEAFFREVLEETGLTVTQGVPVAVGTSSLWDTYGVAFLCEVEGEIVITLSDEHEEYKWVSPSTLPQYLHYRAIAESLASQLQ